MANTSKKLFKGSASRLILLFANIGVGFLMMPFLIHSLGDKQYGLWVLIGSILAFYNLLDIGMSNAMQRFLIRSIHGKNIDDINIALSTSFILSTGIGILSLIATLAIILFAPLFTESETNILLFQMAIGILGTKIAFQFPLYSFYGVLVAKYRFDIISYVQLGALILRTLLIVYFVNMGHGIIAIAVISALADIAGSFLIIYYSRQLAPSIKVSPSNFRLDKLKEYFHFGKYVYIIAVARNIRLTIDELIVGGMIGLSAVTHYTIATTLVRYFTLTIGSAFGVINPLFNKYHKLDQWDNLREVFLITTEVSTYASFLIGGLLILLGQPFISIWIGNEYHDSYQALVILCVASILINAQKPNQEIIVAIAKHKYYAIILSIEAILNLGISLVLVQQIGIYGVALGTLIPSLLNTILLQPIYVCQQLKIPYKVYYRTLTKGVLLAFSVLLPIHYISQSIKIENYLILITVGIVTTFIYILFCFKLFLSNKAITYILESLPNNIKPLVKLLVSK